MPDFRIVKIKKPDDVNIILGQAHFIKTVEDLYEVMAGVVLCAKFGLAFCESSGECLVRSEGNDEELKKLAQENALEIGAGHCFLIMMRGAYPINVLNAVKNTQEVCSIYCASANPVEVVIIETEQGRGILGVVDGLKQKGIEKEDGSDHRRRSRKRAGWGPCRQSDLPLADHPRQDHRPAACQSAGAESEYAQHARRKGRTREPQPQLP